MEPNMITLSCWIEGAPGSFPIEIERNLTIGHLKEAILPQIRFSFPHIEARQLELYAANFLDKKKLRDKFVFKDDDELSGSDTIQDMLVDHFQSSLPPRRIHIAIKKPAPPSAPSHVFPRVKTFATANAALPSFNFYIDPVDLVEHLKKSLLNHKFTLLFGHRQSGKTTTALAVVGHLKSISGTYQIHEYGQPGFEVYYVSLQCGIEFKNRSSFWGSFCRTLRAASLRQFTYDDHEHPSASTFISFFSKKNNPLRKPVILIIDEASILHGIASDNGITEDFIGTLRVLKTTF